MNTCRRAQHLRAWWLGVLLDCRQVRVSLKQSSGDGCDLRRPGESPGRKRTVTVACSRLFNHPIASYTEDFALALWAFVDRKLLLCSSGDVATADVEASRKLIHFYGSESLSRDLVAILNCGSQNFQYASACPDRRMLALRPPLFFKSVCFFLKNDPWFLASGISRAACGHCSQTEVPEDSLSRGVQEKLGSRQGRRCLTDSFGFSVLWTLHQPMRTQA